jgi:ZIP family zinc transporter
VDGSASLVFLAALITALATGLGAVPFLFVREMSRFWLGISNAAAAGLMLGASHALIAEGTARHGHRTVFGMAAGVLLIALGFHFLKGRDDLHIGELKGANASKAVLIVVVMTLHSAAEGIGVGVSFGSGEALATFVTVAIAVHNIPEGLAISLVLVPKGVSVARAAGWSVFSSLPQPLLAVPAFLFVSLFHPFLPFGLGLAAGAMVWVAVGELLPDAFRDAPHAHVATSLTLAFAVMMGFQIVLKG